MKFVNKVDRGFTLIEVMVTVVIIVVLTGGSISAYLNFNKSQSIDSDGRELMTAISRARALSANLVYPTGCTKLKGYSLKSADVSGIHSGVIVTAKCDPADIVGVTEKLLKSSYFLSPFDITFSPGSGYLASGVDLDIILRDITDSTISKTVSVGVYGMTSLSMTQE